MADASDVRKISPVRRVFEILRPNKPDISAIYFYAVLNGLIQLSLPLGIQSIIGFVMGGMVSASLVVLIAAVILGVLLTGLLQVSQMKLTEKIQQRFFAQSAFEFADKLPRLDFRYTDGFYLPELANRFFDVIVLQKGISKLLLDLPTASVQILFGLTLLSFYHPVFIFFGIALALLLTAVIYLTGRRGLETSIQESNYKYRVAGWLEEIARIAKSIRFSKGSVMHIKKNDEFVTGYLRSRTNHFKILLFQYYNLVGFKVIITAAMLIAGSILLVNRQLNIGQFIAAEIVIIMVLNAAEKFILNLDKVYDVLTSVEKLAKVTDKPSEQGGSLQLPFLEEGLSVRVDNLTFGYNADNVILKNVSFNIEQGEKVCIMGADGAGKSTLLKLLTGSYPNFEGAILIDRIPVGNYSLSSLRAQTGVLLGRQSLFLGTLGENITMGNDDISSQEILDLAEKLGFQNLLEGLKDGFDTPTDPFGKRFSSNLIQKTLLLRALLHRPRLLLLEEPWQRIELYRDQVMHYLLQEIPDTTVIAISSDEEFARRCDKIIRMEAGEVIEILQLKKEA